MSEIAYRQAALDDAAEIHSLLLQVAPEMPLVVDTLEREEALYALTRNCARSGESWVAIDGGRIVGFVLVEPLQLGRHYGEHEILELRYAGVAPEHRRKKIFARLIAKVLARLVPVATSVSPRNQSGVSRFLERLGFCAAGLQGGEGRLHWEPGRA